MSAQNQLFFDDFRKNFDQRDKDVPSMGSSLLKPKEKEEEELMPRSNLMKTSSPAQSKAPLDQTNRSIPEKLRVNTVTYDESEKTSLEVMRYKMADYQLERSQMQAVDISASRRQGLIKSQLNIDEMDIEEEAIAEEENPFDGLLLGRGIILESSPKKFH